MATTAVQSPRLGRRLVGRLVADQGDISQARAEQLFVLHGVRLLPTLRRHMRTVLLAAADTLVLRTRAIIETIVDQRKHGGPIEHSRHRSPSAFVVHLLAGLIASCHQPQQPSLGRDAHLLLAA